MPDSVFQREGGWSLGHQWMACSNIGRNWNVEFVFDKKKSSLNVQIFGKSKEKRFFFLIFFISCFFLV